MFSSTNSLTDVFSEFLLQKRSPQWELGLSFEGRQNECSWFCVDVSVLAARLEDEVCPLKPGWMMMDQTQMWPEPGRDQLGCIKSNTGIFTAAVTKCRRGLLITDRWLGSFSVFNYLFLCDGHSAAHIQETLSERCLSTQSTIPHLRCTDNLSQARARISGALLFITTATSITTSRHNCRDKLPQKPVFFLTTQSCCFCCIFEDSVI